MKFNILLLLVLGFISSHAQFNKGDKYIGGSMRVSKYSSSPSSGAVDATTSSYYLGLSPTVGFFLNNKMAFGFTLGYIQSNTFYKFTSFTNETTYKAFNASIFLKRFYTISDNFYFTLTGDINVNRGTNTTSNTSLQTSGFVTMTNEDPSYSLGLGVTPSFIFFPSPKWGLEAGIGSLNCNYQRTLPNDGDTYNLNLQLINTLSIGINYYFRKSE